ncbi:MAG: MFS transporter [Phycisphaerae bacterium]|nr:MFS transporter [Phycisphaerae bacterium]
MAWQNEESSASRGVKGLAVFRALRGRNYRLFFCGQGISLVGTWMQTTALGWLVYGMTDKSKFHLGLLGFVAQIPAFFLSPLAGVFTDRWNRHHALLATQTLLMLQAGVLATLTLAGMLTGIEQFPHVLLLAFMAGLVAAVDVPNRQSFMIDIVDRREHLPNAIALNSFAFNGARLIGPVIAGALIVSVGEGYCFLINALSFPVVIVLVLAIRVPPRPDRPRKHPFRELAEGARYAFGLAPIRAPLILLACMGVFGMACGTLYPVFSSDVLGGQWGLDGGQVQGMLISATGLGAIIGAVYLAMRRDIHGLDRMLGVAPIALGLGLIGFGLSPWLIVSLPLLVVAGFGQMVQMAGTNTILQTLVDDDKRGRLMSFYAMAFMGAAPLGALLYGSLAQWLGAEATLTLCGSACILVAVAYLSRLPRIRREAKPIYERLGINTTP